MTRRRWVAGAMVFAIAALVAGSTVAGPGLSWDEPAYRHSQVTLQSWLRELKQVRSGAELATLLSADAIDVYFEYNRMGHNFHPPMGGYLNLATYGLFGGIIEDVSARRLASAFEFAGCVAILFVAIAGRFGWAAGLFAAATLLFMPRAMGNAHLIDTDMPLLFFWSAVAMAFEAGLTSRGWQWVAAGCFGCLLLVKFSGVVVLAPCAMWFAIRVLLRMSLRERLAWLAQSTMLLAPLLPYAFLFIVRPGKVVREFRVVRMTCWGFDHPVVFWGCFALAVALVAAMQRRRKLRMPSDEYTIAPELPWVLLIVGPLVAIALNPTWWHDPVLSLASYFNLNLDRQAALPNIGIFYLGQRFFYSLPWHNAPVLMAVTIPMGTLLLGTVGCGLGLRGSIQSIAAGVRRQTLSPNAACAGYFLLQCWTLPIFRMAKTPAHDGVRLFLPTFFFWAGLTGMAAAWLADRASARRKLVWTLLWCGGPAFAAFDWARIHPHELSYYNIGLKRAFDCGFEPTYWYDCVTPKVVADLNDRLPPNVAITHFVDPLINAEIFSALHALGRLRNDIDVDPSNAVRRPWLWLLTHSSKATAFTRLLYAGPAWAAYGKDGVKLFSVIEPDAVDVAWALWSLTVDADNSEKLGSFRINELAFAASSADLLRTTELLADGPPAPDKLRAEPAGVRELAAHWLRGGRLHATRATTFRDRRAAVAAAVRLLATRGPDIRKVLESEGYLSPERFGGWLQP